MVRAERRNLQQRAELVQRIVSRVNQNPSVTLTVETLVASLHIPADAAQRILASLAASGIVREVKPGMWVGAPWPGAQGSRF
jgi:hypothetical protein